VVGSDWARALTNGWDANAGVPPWIKLTVPVAVCALVALAGLMPALRAARLTAVQALAGGHSPQIAVGSRLARGAGRLPLPRPVALGIASAFSRPAATLAVVAVIASGVTAAVLAVGLNSQMLQLVVGATTAQNGSVLAGQALVRGLTVLVAVVAGLGVLSTVLMLARQRVHDLGVCKAIGMTPRQIVTMIICWVLAPGLAAAAIALPAGIGLEHAVANTIVNGQTSPLSQVVLPPGVGGAAPPRAQVHRGRPSPSVYRAGPRSSRRVVDEGAPGGGSSPFATVLGLPRAYDPGTLALVVLAGLGIAILGALGPACWAAASKTTTTLRAE
jgi:ABC-type antimicrobial peptide transport system permease subunit